MSNIWHSMFLCEKVEHYFSVAIIMQWPLLGTKFLKFQVVQFITLFLFCLFDGRFKQKFAVMTSAKYTKEKIS